MLDAASGSYIFCPEDEMIGTVIENTDVLNIIEQAKNAGNQAKAFEYTDSVTGKRVISAIYYLEERDWVLVALTDWDIAFSEVRALTGMLAILCFAVLVIISLAVWGCVAVLARDISREADIIQNIGTLDFTERQKLERYCGRKDEVGMIADAMKVLVDAMYQVVEGLKKKCGKLLEMAGEMSGTSSSASGTIRNVETAIHEIAEGAGNQALETENASNASYRLEIKLRKQKKSHQGFPTLRSRLTIPAKRRLKRFSYLLGLMNRLRTQ